jgi:choline dehydrogenase-like flavoprotein
MSNRKSVKTAIVVGTGAGGATIANELQGRYQVTMLEAGAPFKPFSLPIGRMAALRRTGMYLDERLIRLFIPNMLVEKTPDMIMVRGIGVGGTTTLATGNAVRYDGALRDMGIDLDAEFEELSQELPITTDHQKRWTEATQTMYRVFQEMELNPVVTPKLLDASRCIGCGHCAIGCPTGAKWDTRELVDKAIRKGATLVTDCMVTGLEVEGRRVTGLNARQKKKKVSYSADLVILAAGGLGTPEILRKSGIECQDTLFVDPVLCVAGPLKDFHQDRQLLMPFISQQNGYILAPYMDYLSFFFNRDWRIPMRNIVSIMIKLADEEMGNVKGRKINKVMTDKDQRIMARAVAQSSAILDKLGVPSEKQFLGTLNAGHPGGMLPLTEAERETLHSPILPDNLYIADATILPEAMGNPPILTIMALARKIARIV